MKKLSLTCLAAAIISVPAFAASSGASNGQPFQALQQQITANQAAIAANASAISQISVDISDVVARIDVLESAMAAAEAAIAANTDAIAATNARIDSTEQDVAGLSAALSALAQQHAADTAAINAELANLYAELDALNTAREALATELRTQLAALQAQVDGNTFAIDGVVLQLVTINAELTVINSDILTINNTLVSLSAAQDANTAALAALQAQLDALSAHVDELHAGDLLTFSGIQQDLPVADLSGWTECYRATYGAEARAQDMLNACTGGQIMLACAPVGSATLTLAAYAAREEVFLDTGASNNVVHTANGVDWYFSPDYSMGFVAEGTGVVRSSADIKYDGQPEKRMSWHTHSWFSNGYRCGNNYLNGNNSWEKIIYQAN